VRPSWARFVDIVVAMEAIEGHLTRGDLRDSLVFDAVRVRRFEIGEAVTGIDTSLLLAEPGVPWPDIVGFRDHLAHRSFGTDHAIVVTTIERDVPVLLAVLERLMRLVESER
jgi:uncharacterized protein with HEPN domain